VGAGLGLQALFIKDEGVNPTGTFKARGMAVAVSRAAELGARELAVASAGNAGGAAAVYAARGGLTAHVFLPSDAPDVHAAEIRSAGGVLHAVQGLLDDAGREVVDQCEVHGWFDVSTFKEPYRVEGKKTMGFELAEAYGWDLPEVIIYPTGGGTGLVGMWKAFGELEGLGWIGKKRPRLVAVQPEGCAPVVRAWERRADHVERWERAVTAAHGLRVPRPLAGKLILRVLGESRGTAVMVSEAEMADARAELAQREGLLVCLEGAATYAAAKELRSQGWLHPQERVVLFNTGMGLKGL
jgi:threonine synthase